VRSGTYREALIKGTNKRALSLLRFCHLGRHFLKQGNYHEILLSKTALCCRHRATGELERGSTKDQLMVVVQELLWCPPHLFTLHYIINHYTFKIILWLICVLQRTSLNLFGFQLAFLHVKLLCSMTTHLAAHMVCVWAGDWGRMADACEMETHSLLGNFSPQM
jgi:hypothetical protein